MKGKLYILVFVLVLSTLIVSGCRADGKKIVIDVPEVEVDIPEVEIDIPEVEVDEPIIGTSEVIRGSGNVVTEGRPVSDFNRVSLTGFGEVIITQGEEESLIVETDDNLMQYIETEVKNDTLVLGFTGEVKDKNIRPSQGIKFHLSLKDLVGLDIPGAGDINASSLDTDRLKIILVGAGNVNIGSLNAEEVVVRLSGAGNIELEGQVVEQGVLLSGAGAYRAAQLESQTAAVEVSGVGDATVWATDSLDAQLSGVGNVKYYGSPEVTQRNSGFGRLVGLGNP